MGLGFDLPHSLHLDIQHADATAGAYVGDGLEARAVVVPAEGRGFEEEGLMRRGGGGGAVAEGEEDWEGDEVVVDAVCFGGAGWAGCVGNAEAEGVRVGGEEFAQEGRFAGAGGAGEDDGAVFEGWHCGGRGAWGGSGIQGVGGGGEWRSR